MNEIRVRSLGQQDPLEKGTATHSSILAWRTAWTGESGGLQAVEWQRVGHYWATNTFTFFQQCQVQFQLLLPDLQTGFSGDM